MSWRDWLCTTGRGTEHKRHQKEHKKHKIGLARFLVPFLYPTYNNAAICCFFRKCFYLKASYSPPKLGGVPSRSEGGAVCSKSARSALLVNIRVAHRL